MQLRRQSTGEIITLHPGSLLGTGGEARVYSLTQEANLVAKIYHQPDLTRIQKLAAMIANPPEVAEAGRELQAVAWPLDLLVTANEEQKVVGFLMPRIAAMRSIADFYNPRTRRQFNPLFNYFYLHRTARNLATAVRSLHERGYVVGDINESNILISETAVVTLVDADSFQVHDQQNQKVFRCAVGKPEFTPPELQYKAFADVDRLPEHDLFGLAVILFQLLMEGTHPFAGQFRGNGEPPPIKERIAAGHFVYGTKFVPYQPAPVAPRFTMLDPALQSLFVRCFEDGHKDPKARPTAGAWQVALAEAETLMRTCRINEQHRYGNHLQSCPWCERAKLLQGRDPFPSRKVVQAGQHLYTAKPAVDQEPTKQNNATASKVLFASVPTRLDDFLDAIRSIPQAIPKTVYIVLPIMALLLFTSLLRSIQTSPPKYPYQPRYGTQSAPPPPVKESVTVELTSEEIINAIEEKMVRIPSGTFMMGSPEGVGDDEETPQHRVTISSFAISQTEVTQEQWRAVANLPEIKTNLPLYPSRYYGDLLPVESISWNEAVEFCERLSRKTGRKYRLPTEAEWEYACRAGMTKIYPTDNNVDKLMWYVGNSNGTTQSVAQTKPNSWGLYDMYGNVWEWCADWYGEKYYSRSSATNPKGVKKGKMRVIRGGGWDNAAGQCRPAYRDKAQPDGNGAFLGMRLAMTLNPKEKTSGKRKKIRL